MKQKTLNKILNILAIILIIMLTTINASAHSGRTDSSGGHRDNKNVSGLGSYHYHCGGNPAHLHTNGVCPYKTSSNSSISSSNSNASNSSNKNNQNSINTEKQKANKLGYNKGYSDGYNSNSFNDSTSEKYSTDYKEGYKSGYDKGVSDLNDKKEEVYNSAYKIGKNGLSNNNKETNKLLIEAYNNGYKAGYNEYLINSGEDFSLMGENDAISFNDKIKFPPTVNSSLVRDYNNAYDNKMREMESVIYKKGFETALSGQEYVIQNYEHNIEEEWYEKGFNAGLNGFIKEKKVAYNKGAKGEAYEVPTEYEIVKEDIQKEYNEGLKKRKKPIKVILGIGLLGGSGYVVAKKKNLV